MRVLVQREAEGKYLAEGKDAALRAGIFKASGSPSKIGGGYPATVAGESAT